MSETVTHPSQPNYAAVVSGDYYGLDNDNFQAFPENISTVVDLLDVKSISWGEYQEDMPSAGFTGSASSTGKTTKNDYVRRHNPLVLYDSVANNATRLGQIKTFTSFRDDMETGKLPQWAFITPNMTNNGHDTNIAFAASWAKGFLEPLLSNGGEFAKPGTLVVVTFDESEDYREQNRIYTVLLGGAVDPGLRGTTDDTFYTHYSTISSVSVNWGLPSLGRWDCGANVFQLVANKTGYRNTAIDLTNLFLNTSNPGPLNSHRHGDGRWPNPNTEAKCASGLGVLDSVRATWGTSSGTFNYTSTIPNELASNSPSSNSSTNSNVASVATPPLIVALGVTALVAAWV